MSIESATRFLTDHYINTANGRLTAQDLDAYASAQTAELQAKLKALSAALDDAREGLKYISNPILAMQIEAEREGNKIDGMMAVVMSKDAGFLSQQAKSALARIDALTTGGEG